MDNRIIILVCIGFIFIFVFIFNIYKFRQQNKKFAIQLQKQNKRIIFVNNPNINIKEECFQPNSFFLMNNCGSNPCEETKSFNYKSLSNKRDYYMVRKSEV